MPNQKTLIDIDLVTEETIKLRPAYLKEYIQRRN
jgi:hypothetical protein